MRGLAFERRQSLYVRNRPKESQLARDGRRRMKFQVASIYGREAYREEKKTRSWRVEIPCLIQLSTRGASSTGIRLSDGT
jgi:hypothetical protein